MAEAFALTLKRDSTQVDPFSDARTVIEQLPASLTRYNEIHPRKALSCRSLREYMVKSARPRRAFGVNSNSSSDTA